MFSDEEFINHMGDSIPAPDPFTTRDAQERTPEGSVSCLRRPSSVLEEELTSDQALAGRVGRAPLATEQSFEGQPCGKQRAGAEMNSRHDCRLWSPSQKVGCSEEAGRGGGWIVRKGLKGDAG